jgi:uncharacterized paraquat-inducible protein A
MDLPEPPLMDLPTATSFRCPCCNKNIATWVVSARFSCPSCEKPLSSNKRQAFNRGLIAGTAAYLVLAALMYLVASPGWVVFIYLAGFTVAFYIGYLIYRSSVVITKWQG